MPDGLRRGMFRLVLVIDVARNTACHRTGKCVMVRVMASYTADDRTSNTTFRVSRCAYSQSDGHRQGSRDFDNPHQISP